MPRASRPRSRSPTRPKTGRRLATRLRDNGRVLLDAYRTIAAAIREERAITPAAEWLVDNFHVVEEQIREIRDDLPARLLSSTAQACRRAAGGLSARLRNRLGVRRAYRQPLRSADAVPIRAGLSARAAADDRRALGGRDHAANRAGGEFAARRPSSIVERAGRRARRPTRWPTGCWASAAARPSPRKPCSRASIERRCRRPSRSSWSSACAIRIRKVTPALLWLDERLAGPGHDGRRDRPRGASGARRDERDGAQRDHEHAPDVRGRLGGVLRERQPGRCGAARRTATLPRWIFRRAIAIGTRSKNWREAPATPRSRSPDARSRPPSARPRRAGPRRRHRSPRAGSRAITSSREGGARSRRSSDFALPISEWLVRANAAAGILGLSRRDRGRQRVHSRACCCCALAEYGVGGWTLFVLAILAAAARRSDAAVALVNRGVTTSIGPATTLPALELRDGVPASLRTMVVVPTLLTTPAELEEQIERLEVHYLASPGRRSSLRAALGLDRFRDRDMRRATTSCSAPPPAAIARLEPALRTGAGWRALPPAPSPADLERGARESGWDGSASAASCTS